MRGALLALMLAATPVLADTSKPWAAGVSEAEQATALGIYREGNAEFEESRYPQALAKYRAALTHWDHPGIRFNMAVSLINLDQPVEALDHLERALVFGDAPLGPEAHAQAQTYLKLLHGQLSTIKVTCDAAGAEVTFDGKKLLACPGEAKQRVTPGPHQVVASKPGFMTETAPLVLLPGKELVHAVKLVPVETGGRTKLVRRWNARTPWIIVGAGLGAAALGGLALYFSSNEYQTHDDLLLSQCPDGCGPNMPPGMQEVAASTKAHETRGRIFNVTGVALLSLGGAATIAGLVGVYMNQPRAVRDTAPVVTPTLGPNAAGASVRFSF